MVDTDNKKYYIYVDGHERPDVVAYRNQFCDRWFTKYLPRMSYFEGLDVMRLYPELKVGKAYIF